MKQLVLSKHEDSGNATIPNNNTEVDTPTRPVPLTAPNAPIKRHQCRPSPVTPYKMRKVTRGCVKKPIVISSSSSSSSAGEPEEDIRPRSLRDSYVEDEFCVDATQCFDEDSFVPDDEEVFDSQGTIEDCVSEADYPSTQNSSASDENW